MKTRHAILLTLACCVGFATGQAEEFRDYVLPLPDRFVEFADKALNAREVNLNEYFQMQGINLPAGSKIEIDRNNNSLDARLPQQEALKVIQLLNFCITQSSARFFRPCEPLDAATAEADAKNEIPIPEAHTDLKEVSLIQIARTENEPVFLLINPTNHPIWYHSIPRVQIQIEGQWTEHRFNLFCGVGEGTHQLLPKRATYFGRGVIDLKPPVRIGLRLLDDISIQLPDNTVWSEPIR